MINNIMKSIIITLVANKLVFSGDFPQEDKVVKSWDFYSDKIDKAAMKDLYTKAVANAVGWSTCDIESTYSSETLLLRPIFFVDSLQDELTEDEQAILEKIIVYVDAMVSKYSVVKQDFPIYEENFYSDADVVVFREPGQSYSREFQSFLQKLKENEIPFYIEYEHSKEVDQGASGGLHEAIVFIGGAIASGVAYDMIKGVASFNLLNLKKERTDVLKEKIAHHLNTMPENIDITQIDKKEESIFIKVKFNRTGYEFTFDNENELMKFNEGETF